MPLDKPRRPGASPLVAPLPLAQGELAEADAAELVSLKAQIRDQLGFQSHGYKEKCLRRRLAVRMRACGVHRYADYAALLATDPTEVERLLSTLTINVSKFFRNPEVWDALAATVIPTLFEGDEARVRIWSAGCASGEEPYTVAILLREHAEATGRLDALERFSIVGTDIDRAVLEEAKRAVYPPLALTETSDARRERWFTPRAGAFALREEARSMVRFRKHDLLAGVFEPGWNLIVCRNVIIYFERLVQDDLFTRFAEALRPDGVLVLGKVETLFGPASRSLRAVSGGSRIYVKT